MHLFFRLVQSEAGKDIAPEVAWKNDAQVLAVKIFRHLASVQHLSSGAQFDYGGISNFEFIDHSSIGIVTRAALETYLAFYFIYINTEERLSIYRHKIWQLAGLIDRSKLFANSDDSKWRFQAPSAKSAA